MGRKEKYNCESQEKPLEFGACDQAFEVKLKQNLDAL